MADEPTTFGMRAQSHRVDRFCDACGQVDSAPHHIAALSDGSTTDRHMDCCALAGCPDQTCNTVIAAAGDKRNDALVRHISKGGADEANYTAKES